MYISLACRYENMPDAASLFEELLTVADPWKGCGTRLHVDNFGAHLK